MRVPELSYAAAVQALSVFDIRNSQAVSNHLSYKGRMSNEHHNLRSPYQDGI
jgi:hypothetical protein